MLHCFERLVQLQANVFRPMLLMYIVSVEVVFVGNQTSLAQRQYTLDIAPVWSSVLARIGMGRVFFEV